MNEDFLPVSDDRDESHEASVPQVSETGFADGTLNEIPAEQLAEFNPAAAEIAEAPVEVPTLHVGHPRPSLWDQLRELFRNDRGTLIDRIADVDRAIELAPNAAGNYVLRGELYLESREYELAAADFEYGLELAQADYETSSWGLVAQAVQDRALNGLQKAARKMKKRSAT